MFSWTPAEKGDQRRWWHDQYLMLRFCSYTVYPGWVLSAFFYGYVLTQVPGGWLATRFGGKHVYGVGVVMTSVLTLLTPLAAEFSVWMLVAVRVLEGMFEVGCSMWSYLHILGYTIQALEFCPCHWSITCWCLISFRWLIIQGVTYPAMLALLGRWAPKSERSFMATAVQSGAWFWLGYT